MITGRVDNREACIDLTIRGPLKQEHTVRAVIDTGFTAFLSLPPDLIVSLGLDWRSSGRGVLADGSECLFDVFAGKVIWDGQERNVLIDEADTDPLVGMALLSGYELKIENRPNGKVSIKRLRSTPDHGSRHRQNR
jgi:clan AA aspartic protease